VDERDEPSLKTRIQDYVREREREREREGERERELF